MIKQIKLTKKQFDTLLFITNGQTVFYLWDLLQEPLLSFLGKKNIPNDATMVVFVK